MWDVALKARPRRIRLQNQEVRGESSAEVHEKVDRRERHKYERVWTVWEETEDRTRKMCPKCYFLLHREAWMYIGRRNAQSITTEGYQARGSSAVPLIWKEIEKEKSSYIITPSFIARGWKQGAPCCCPTRGPWPMHWSTISVLQGADLGKNEGAHISYSISIESMIHEFFLWIPRCGGVAKGLPRWTINY